MGKTLLFFLLVSYKLSFSADLLISEVLFNPKTGGVDFVEIYNPTDKALSLNNVQLGNLDADGMPANFKSIGAGSLNSGAYCVISVNAAKLKADYYTPSNAYFIQLSAMPAYNNENGHVLLLRGGGIIDQLDYTEKLHLPTLEIFKGVSLERVSFERATNETGNFSSASASVGFATPGYRNSVQENASLKKSNVTLYSKSFSPDGDGFEDLLQVSYELKYHGNMATVTIYTDQGFLVRRLIRNESVGTSGTLTWNGVDDQGQTSPFGIYILVFKSFDLNGNQVNIRKAFSLAGKFK